MALRTAPKQYTCDRCETVIHEGTQYERRTFHNGIHHQMAKFHRECWALQREDDMQAEEAKGK